MLIGAALVFFLIAALVLVWVSLTMKKGQVDAAGEWGTGTRFFLVLLRLAIGWHFLVEGLDKVRSPSWSSEVYLREASGPLAPVFRNLGGDALADRLAVGPNNEFPKELAGDWENYLDHFKDYYELDSEQAARAKTVLQQAESKTLTWLTVETKMIKKSTQVPPVMVAMTVPERLKALTAVEEQIRSIEDDYRATFGRDTFTKLQNAKKESKSIRSELKSDLDKQTDSFKKALADVLGPDQKKMATLPEPVGRPFWEWSTLEWIDHKVKFGLVAVGVCLLGGLLTRTACVGGALFLLMFFLSMPPLPGWPDNPRAEGHYLYINKNIIEMLALLALATTRSGRWAGLDGLLQFLNPWRKQSSTDWQPSANNSEDFPRRETSATPPHGAGQEIVAPLSKETAHGP